jgi:hypothetical protein
MNQVGQSLCDSVGKNIIFPIDRMQTEKVNENYEGLM